MGGGDLNLKKSWHPSTQKNIEKVWKAEQQNNEEKRRIAELKREIEMERDREEITEHAMQHGVIEKKDNKKLDWMYKGPNSTVNTDEYLMGKRIDKAFEDSLQASKDAEANRVPKNHVEHECIPPSLRNFVGTEQVDLARKLQEDPLYAIKKKVIESRTQLLKNPLKLKKLKEQSEKLQSMKRSKKSKKKDLEAKLDYVLASKYKKLKGEIKAEDLIKELKKSKKDKKKSKKRRKSNSSSSSSSSSESDNSNSESDSESRRKKKRRDLSPQKRVCKEEERRKRDKHDQRDVSRSERKERNRSRERSRSRDRNVRNRSRSRERSRSRDRNVRNRSRSRERTRSRERKVRNRSRSRSREIKNFKGGSYGLMNADGSKVNRERRTEFPVREKVAKKVDKEEKKYVPMKREKLSDEEKQRRLREMMKDAEMRDKERAHKVRKYWAEEEKEKTENSFSKEFMTKELAKAAHASSLESRIKSNLNNIQRSKTSMNSHFARR